MRNPMHQTKSNNYVVKTPLQKKLSNELFLQETQPVVMWKNEFEHQEKPNLLAVLEISDFQASCARNQFKDSSLEYRFKSRKLPTVTVMGRKRFAFVKH